MTDMDRADKILAAYDLIPDTDDKPDIQVILTEAIDGTTNSSIHRLIRDSFTTDDDADDLRHEIEHAMHECDEDDPNCPWNDTDDMAF